MARPVWTPTDPQRRQAETMAAYGIPEADIARVLGVSKPTLRKHCGTELDTGATRANSKVADFLFYGICGGTGKPAFKDERARVTAAIFWMKTRGGWSETSTHKHTGVANGSDRGRGWHCQRTSHAPNCSHRCRQNNWRRS